MCNIFIIWRKSSDFDSLYSISRKFNINRKDFCSILDNCSLNYDFIVMDQTNPDNVIRLNGYEPIFTFNKKKV